METDGNEIIELANFQKKLFIKSFEFLKKNIHKSNL